MVRYVYNNLEKCMCLLSKFEFIFIYNMYVYFVIKYYIIDQCLYLKNVYVESCIIRVS